MTPEGEKALALVLDQKNERIASVEAEKREMAAALADQVMLRENAETELAHKEEIIGAGRKLVTEAQARAENAEAEVERLRSENLWARRFILQSGFGALPDLKPEEEGGGRESGAGAGSGREPRTTQAGSAAANPAALIEPEFSAFVAAMRKELMDNGHKGDSWRKEGWDIVKRLREELNEALAPGASKEEWADVANFAFFAWARAARKERGP